MNKTKWITGKDIIKKNLVGEKNMKKIILPFLAIGILVLCGLEAGATTNNDEEPTNIPTELEITIKGGFGFGVTAIVTNVGNEELKDPVDVIFEINNSITGDRESATPITLPLQVDDPESVHSGFVFGLGRCVITVSVDYDQDGEPDMQTARKGFILGPWVLVGYDPIPIP